MRVERVSDSQFTIFLTFDDLMERGFTKEDLWYDASNVRDLFSDMMYEASTELDFELEGMLIVQVHLMQAQGMHVVVTQKIEPMNWNDDYIEMKVTLDESKELIFSFTDFEYVIQVARLLFTQGIKSGKVFYWDGKYYMLFDEEMIQNKNREDMIAILSEFSTPSIITSHRLEAYGNKIMEQNAVHQLTQTFFPYS